jgi:hypothetical protein
MDAVSGYAVSRISSSLSHYRCVVLYSKSPISLFSSALRCLRGGGRSWPLVGFPCRSICLDRLFGEVRSIEALVDGRDRAGDVAKGFGGNIGDDASSIWFGMASAG